MKTIGFIGAGIMGKSMIRNLMKAGFELHVYDINSDAIKDVVSEGAHFHATVSDCVKNREAVISIVGRPADVEAIYYGENGIFASAEKGAYLIDMTTSSPSLARKLHEDATKNCFHSMDAPVTGGDTGAKSGTLSILVGGDKADFEACLDIFRALGTNINYQGGPGSGQHTKMANQIILAGVLSGIAEGIAYAKTEGLDGEIFLKSVSTGAARSMQLDLQGPKLLAGDYAPGFQVKHFIKDMRIAVHEADVSGIDLKMLKTVLAQYEKLDENGMGELGMQALVKYYEL